MRNFSVLVEITRTQVGCYYAKLACAWRSLRLAALPLRTFELPTRDGITLPARCNLQRIADPFTGGEPLQVCDAYFEGRGRPSR